MSVAKRMGRWTVLAGVALYALARAADALAGPQPWLDLVRLWNPLWMGFALARVFAATREEASVG